MTARCNPNYRVEHVAETPRGWHVRTKMQATHMLRIAFPPGPRKKGSGKVVEIFHPVNENPCHLAESQSQPRRSSQKNPGPIEQAADLYKEFHGEDPRHIAEMQESDAQRHTFTQLGELVELKIKAPAGTVKIGFGGDAVKVASSPNGRQLYLLGGNQNIDGAIDRFGVDATKDFIVLGAAMQITYRARKSFDGYKSVDYYHDLGEETGDVPVAFYDKFKHRIFLAGGAYRVEAPGIIN
jgi:hypothetical protein